VNSVHQRRSNVLEQRVAIFERLTRSFQARLMPPRLAGYRRHFRPLLIGRRVLEIGGPSGLFAINDRMPFYRDVGSLDNVNFSQQTIWEGTIESGHTFAFNPNRPPGRQFIAEASALTGIASGSYDGVLSSHTLEHAANALATLREWMRVLKDDGALVLVLPHKDGTFDHRRPVTTLAHLLDDERVGVDERDQTHLAEILDLHDLSRDNGAGAPEAFEARSRRNYENRSLHHHVFDTALVIQMLDAVGLQVLHVEPFLMRDIAVAARKLPPGMTPDNHALMASDAAYRRSSPFPSDRA
jgi:SAM-dependent methyltransferase